MQSAGSPCLMTVSPLAPVAYAAALVARRVLPLRARKMLVDGRIDAVMSHYLLVTGRLVEAVRAGGGQLYVWTVDDARRIRELEALGVDGVITNDPRLFEPAPA